MRTSSFVILLIIVVVLAGAAYYFLVGANSPTPNPLYGQVNTPNAPNTGAPDSGMMAASSSTSTSTTVVAVNVASSSALGTYLVAANGMTLYVYTNDTPGKSVCTGTCATTWPPYTVLSAAPPAGGPGVTGTLGTILRADTGSIQLTYKGAPLYFFRNDVAPGETNGSGASNAWKVARP